MNVFCTRVITLAEFGFIEGSPWPRARAQSIGAEVVDGTRMCLRSTYSGSPRIDYSASRNVVVLDTISASVEIFNSSLIISHLISTKRVSFSLVVVVARLSSA